MSAMTAPLSNRSSAGGASRFWLDRSTDRSRHGVEAETLKPISNEALRAPSSVAHLVGSVNLAFTPSPTPVAPIVPESPRWQMLNPSAPNALWIAPGVVVLHGWPATFVPSVVANVQLRARADPHRGAQRHGCLGGRPAEAAGGRGWLGQPNLAASPQGQAQSADAAGTDREAQALEAQRCLSRVRCVLVPCVHEPGHAVAQVVPRFAREPVGEQCQVHRAHALPDRPEAVAHARREAEPAGEGPLAGRARDNRTGDAGASDRSGSRSSAVLER